MEEADIEEADSYYHPIRCFQIPLHAFWSANAAQVFQHLIDSLFHSFLLCSSTKITCSFSHSEHLLRLDQIFSTLAENGLHINPENVSFQLVLFPFLPMLPPSCPPLPPDIKSLQRFLGMVNFYCHFLPGIAHVLAPLTSATKGKGRLTWTPEVTLSFQTAKSSLASAVPFKHPDPSAPLSLATDASDSQVGAILHQKFLGSWKPLAFFSKKLKLSPCTIPIFHL